MILYQEAVAKMLLEHAKPGSSPTTIVSLHTAEPEEDGDLHEATYANYARAEARADGDELYADFNMCQGRGCRITHAGIWIAGQLQMTSLMHRTTELEDGMVPRIIVDLGRAGFKPPKPREPASPEEVERLRAELRRLEER